MRWDERRLAAYADYANAVKKVISLATRLAAHQGLHQETEALEPDIALPAISAAEDERTIKWETFLLVGSKDAVVAAREWHESVWLLESLAKGETGEVAWPEALEATSLARSRYYHTTRRDLGITGVDTGEAWQLGKWSRRESTSS